MSVRLAAALACCAVAILGLLVAGPAVAANSQAVQPTPTLTRPASPTKPPTRHFLSAVQATAIAASVPGAISGGRGLRLTAA